jgi:glycerol-3-phosphate cytidylyltransferase-like family protein
MGRPKKIKKEEGKTESPTNMSPCQKAEMEKDIQLSRMEYENNVRNVFQAEKAKEVESLIVVLKEYLESFIVLGYDLNGMPIELINLTSPMGQDALVERLRKLGAKVNYNMHESNGTNPFGVGKDEE